MRAWRSKIKGRVHVQYSKVAAYVEAQLRKRIAANLAALKLADD